MNRSAIAIRLSGAVLACSIPLATGLLADHALASARYAKEIYAINGSQGFANGQVKPGTMKIEQGQIRWSVRWKTWGTTAVTRSAKEKECSKSSCSPWGKVTLKLYDVKYRTERLADGSKYQQPYYSKLQDSFGGEVLRYDFSDDHSKVPEWHNDPCDTHQTCS